MSAHNMEIDKPEPKPESMNRLTGKLSKAYGLFNKENPDGGLGPDEMKNLTVDILNSLHCGVVVTGLDGEVYLENPEARRLGVAADGLIKKWLAEIKSGNLRKKSRKKKIEWDGPDGRKLSTSISTLKRDKGEITGFVFVIEDVTGIARIRKQSMRADRLAAIGEMAAGMAHEIRNPLGGIEIFTSLLARELVDDKEKLRMLEHIKTGVQSINNVVSNFLLFTVEPKPRKKEFDLKKLILDTLEFANYVFDQYQITVKAYMPEKELPMVGDPDLIRQVLLNMIHNSTQAMPKGGEFRISAKAIEGEEEPTRLEINCSDTGPGTPAHIREKIFDPFVTTKESGAGLGLAIVSQIVQAHGGYVDLLETEPDKGASFIISLPMRGEHI